ncbi:MAG: hypothetical protein JNL01_01340 [Bdellovibrionales bacterium]|nr:hypothetical protein [Bdellovibrionales bacterium]
MSNNFDPTQVATPDQRLDFDDHTLNRDYYIRLAKEKGVSYAITELHHEKEKLEHATFEGDKGYRPELFERVQEYAAFSRELWDIALDSESIERKDWEKRPG